MLRQVADGVRVHVSDFILSNAVIVDAPAGALLIDPGITAAELGAIAGELGTVAAGFSTHPHWDHLLWDARFGDAPRYGTSAGAAIIRDFLARPDWREDIAEGLPPDVDVPLDLLGLIAGVPAGTTHIPWDGPRVRIIEHRGHEVGHAALLIEKVRVLVAGDMLSDHLIPMLESGSADAIGDYLAALDLFESVADDVDVVIPGHGSVGDNTDLRGRIALDRAYVLALREGTPVDDPRITSPAPGWEWVAGLHNG